MWKGKRHWETLKMQPTPPNLKHASRLREDICAHIAIGAFDYGKFFPDSDEARAAADADAGPTFREQAQKWLATISHLADSTRNDYRRRLERHIYPVIGDKRVRHIVYGDLAALLGNIEWGSMKSRNNTATVIRQPFDLAFLDGLIETNPAARIRNMKSQKEPPDPFSLEEINAIVDTMKKLDPAYANYFEFAFFTGLRTSELLALRWEDIDWNMGLVRVSRAKVDTIEKGTKTSRVRDVELNSRALEALARQKPLSLLAGKEVFINPNTGKSIHTLNIVHPPWRRTIKACGIRYRNPYQARHTFATLNLMAGANPMWVSRQMGHTSMKMLLEVYSRWIDMADRSREKNKLETLLSVPTVCQRKTAQSEDRAVIG
ncbi:tyrosine-type recombinase/integrase [Paludibacterium yongneupense]|uniref:tyrosine-type recombinase/integrase n=1 Tax=Paludibacterium yongneupense TaxID=400061 RepID=UPI00041D85C5|nr:site-specific integrase [Paludibacterium yongneupense]